MDTYIGAFTDATRKQVTQFREFLIRGDAAKQIIIIDEEELHVTGILHFGDYCMSRIACDVFIVGLYVMSLARDKLARYPPHVSFFFNAYQGEFPLNSRELQCICPLFIVIRVQSMSIGTWGAIERRMHCPEVDVGAIS